jgi:hypothetical protein
MALIRTYLNLRKRNGTQEYDYWSMCDTPIVSRSISRASGEIFAPEGRAARLVEWRMTLLG